MATTLPPVDTSIVLPESVRRAAAAAEALHKQAYQTPDTPAPDPAQVQQPATQPAQLPPDPDQPINIVAVSEPPQPATQPATQQPDPTQVQPAPVAAPAEPSPQPDNWEHRYYSMKGRYDQSQQTIAGLQENLSEASQELMRMTNLISQQPQRQQPQRQQPQRLLTAEDEKTYGPELLDTIKRAAQEAVLPAVNEVRQQTQQVKQTVTQQAIAGVYADLYAQVSNWEEINNSPRFKQWLSLRDIYSGAVRGQMLRQAFNAANAPRVLAFFKGFLAEEQATGQLPNPASPQPPVPAPRTAAVPLVNLAAPGVRPASDTNAPADKPIFTHKQIAEFYSHQGRARYVGREEDRKNDEREIFAAQREGRIR